MAFVMNIACDEARTKLYILEIIPVNKNNDRVKSHFGNTFNYFLNNNITNTFKNPLQEIVINLFLNQKILLF